MSLTQAQIEHLGKLTALHPGENIEISNVLNSFDSLGKTNTSHISQISRSGNSKLILRDDIAINSDLADNLLACSNQKKAAHQIVLG